MDKKFDKIKTQVQEPEFKKELAEVARHEVRKRNTLKAAAGFLAGGAGIVSLMSFTSNPHKGGTESEAIPLPESPKLASSVSNDLEFNDAFEAARAEVGAGGYFLWQGKPFSTYYKEEWDKLSSEEHAEFFNNVMKDSEDWPEYNPTIAEAITLYETAPISQYVDDEMSFSDAFAVAREEVGSGGVFQWQGKLYSTFTKQEWESMDAEDKVAYQDSVNNTDLPDYDLICNCSEYLDPEVITIPINDFSQNEVFLGTQTVELDGGGFVTVGVFTHNGEVIYKVDADNNGQYDYRFDMETDEFYSLSTNEVVRFETTENQVEQLSVPISTENIILGGHQALVTTFADGSVESLVDFDDDGTYESLVKVATDGKITIYDSNGNLMHEEVAENLFYESDGGGSLFMDNHDYTNNDEGTNDSGFNNDADTGEWTT